MPPCNSTVSLFLHNNIKCITWTTNTVGIWQLFCWNCSYINELNKNWLQCSLLSHQQEFPWWKGLSENHSFSKCTILFPDYSSIKYLENLWMPKYLQLFWCWNKCSWFTTQNLTQSLEGTNGLWQSIALLSYSNLPVLINPAKKRKTYS